MGLVGPNGSGKTTFFNTISGFVNPGRGQIFFNGKEITHTPPHEIPRLGIARTFQNLELFPYMTVLQNVMVGAHNHLLARDALKNLFSRNERERQELLALETLDFVGITGFERSRVAGLPFGIQKLVELARALATRPKLLLLDEPSSGMNEQETAEMGRIIGDIREDLGITILVVEHDMSLVMSISDRVTVLTSGEILAEGTPTEVKSNRDVIEAFLGSNSEDRATA